MTIPNSNEVEEALSLIAAQIAAANKAVNEIKEKTKPLTDERTDLQVKITEVEEWFSEEVKYSHAREQEMYEAYLKVKQMWEKFRDDTRSLKQKKQGDAALRVNAIDEELWDSKKDLRQLEQELDSLQRQWDQALRRKKDAENYASIEERLSKAAMGAPWREWAKDHQIEGGKRIAYRGKLLLGDTMGLGKTLTSIIAVDLIRAMTAHADEEHPVVIETN